jgi:hypothetical protein
MNNDIMIEWMKNGLYFGRIICVDSTYNRFMDNDKRSCWQLNICVILIYCYHQTYLKNKDVFKKIMLYYDNIKK